MAGNEISPKGDRANLRPITSDLTFIEGTVIVAIGLILVSVALGVGIDPDASIFTAPGSAFHRLWPGFRERIRTPVWFASHRGGSMNRSKMRGLVHSPDDEATVRRWRRAVCVFYGFIGLVLVAAWGVYRLVNYEYQDAGIVDAQTPTSVSAVPSTGRQ